MKITYIKAGRGYQLVSDYTLQTDIQPSEDIITERIHLLKTGDLKVLSGYWWDGTSGPVVDRKTNMRAGCGHDALYELMRKGMLLHSCWRKADIEFAKVLKQDGAWPVTVWADMTGLKLAGGSAALPENRRPRFTAP